MKEIFKEIDGYDHYSISNFGRVYSSYGKGRFLKPGINTLGYEYVRLSNNGKVKNFMIHQLVAIYFLDHVPSGHKIIIDHIDNNPLNNRLDNLQLISNRENTSKDRIGGTSEFVGVSYNKKAGKFQSCIYILVKVIHLGYYECDKEASVIYQLALLNIDKFINPKQFRTYLNNLYV